jgi:methylmalonyl-CoA mutase N-terminal domain/subunit
VRQHIADQNEAVVTGALEQVRLAALSEETNLLVPMRRALQSGATLGQICDQLRAVFGEHRVYG